MNRLTVAVTMVLLGTSTAHAQLGTTEQVPQNTFANTDLIGKTVLDVEGQKIGEISDLVTDQDQRVEAVVVAMGGFFGFGGKEVLLSTSKLQPNGTDRLRVGFTQKQMEALPVMR